MDFVHLESYFNNISISKNIQEQYYRFEPFLINAIRQIATDEFEKINDTNTRGIKECWISFYNTTKTILLVFVIPNKNRNDWISCDYKRDCY